VFPLDAANDTKQIMTNASPSNTPAGTLTIARFELGPFATNCYVVSAGNSGECWIIDASFEPEDLIEHIRVKELRPVALILTHTHVDHIAGVDAVRAAFPRVSVWVHRDEASWLGDPVRNLSLMYGEPVTLPPPDRVLVEGDVLALGSTSWRVLHTPGHSPGGLALVEDSAFVAIVGDALFSGSIGRTDIPGSSFDVLARSIRTKLYTLPDVTRVLAGHGPETTIGREKRGNSFVRAQ
jgi:glyoxylase-like metal-dependent hydrolase (beta-lactamase superfamily II)